MADNQEEKIKFLIKQSGLGVDEAILKLKIAKQTFYNNIRKEPISDGFKLKLREVLKIDIDKSLNSIDQELERLKKENEALKRENELLKTIEALRKKIGD
jgi:predicted RNase H-like nuclease (RuvC/YqgF family)